jgi:transposase
MRRKRRQYSAEFRLEAVRQVVTGDRSVAAVARDLGMHPGVLGTWTRRAEARAAPRAGPLTPDELAELRRLRQENATLREEREILKKATAFFAKDAQ